MEYNKTKRGLEKAAGIVGVIVSSISIIIYIAYTIYGTFFLQIFLGYQNTYNYSLGKWVYGPAYQTGSALYLLFLIPLTISFFQLLFCSDLISSPVKYNYNNEESIQPRKGKRIAVIVFSALTCQFVTLGLIIAVLCLKDYTKPSKCNSNSTFNNQVGNQKTMTLDEKIAKLKELKDLSVITDEQYKKSIEKIISEL